MKNLLNQFIDYYDKSEEFRQQMGKLQRAVKTDDWKFYSQLLLTIKGIMANDMFSRTHTNLDAQEKDVVQRTYRNIDQILTFLLDPIRWMGKRSKWAVLKSNLKQKEKTNGKGRQG